LDLMEFETGSSPSVLRKGPKVGQRTSEELQGLLRHAVAYTVQYIPSSRA
jgi:hypothetical protein